jgi:hypothetical protein
MNKATSTGRLDTKGATVIVKRNQLVGLDSDTRGNSNISIENDSNHTGRLILDNKEDSLFTGLDSSKDARNSGANGCVLVGKFREKRRGNLNVRHN